MPSNALTVEAYLDSLPADRKNALSKVRAVILAHLPEGFEEAIQYGMVGYHIPLSRYPNTYNGEPLSIAALASQKNHMSLYLMGLYSDPSANAWFREEYAKTGKKLDMGKSCVRFKKLEDLPLDLVGQAIAMISVSDLITAYEASRGISK